MGISEELEMRVDGETGATSTTSFKVVYPTVRHTWGYGNGNRRPEVHFEEEMEEENRWFTPWQYARGNFAPRWSACKLEEKEEWDSQA